MIISNSHFTLPTPQDPSMSPAQVHFIFFIQLLPINSIHIGMGVRTSTGTNLPVATLLKKIDFPFLGTHQMTVVPQVKERCRRRSTSSPGMGAERMDDNILSGLLQSWR